VTTSRALVVATGIIGAFSLLTAPAKADIYTVTTDHCSGGCGTGEGTVTVTQDGANTVKIDVEGVGSGFDFIASGAGVENSFFFNIKAITGGNVDNPTISVSNLTSGWQLVSTTAGSYAGDGLSGDFEYALTCHFSGGACEQNGSAGATPPPLIFDVTAAGLTAASFNDPGGTSGANTAEFAADVLAAGNTGLVGFSMTASTVPEPSSLWVLGIAFAGLTIIARKKLQTSKRAS
jgi:PEP-CTERM motif